MVDLEGEKCIFHNVEIKPFLFREALRFSRVTEEL